jgi:hypothetical protein
MKRFIIPLVCLTLGGGIVGGGIGWAIGINGNTSALQGCELVMSTVSEDLSDCQWERSDCEHRLSSQVKRNQSMFRTLLPNHMERTQ